MKIAKLKEIALNISNDKSNSTNYNFEIKVYNNKLDLTVLNGEITIFNDISFDKNKNINTQELNSQIKNLLENAKNINNTQEPITHYIPAGVLLMTQYISLDKNWQLNNIINETNDFNYMIQKLIIAIQAILLREQ